MARRHAFILIVVCLLTRAAAACVCAGVPTRDRSFASADVVFEGVVVEKRIVLTRSYDWYLPVDEYELAVVHVWKGVTGPRVTLIGSHGSCARHFAAGRRYVIYAVKDERPGVFTDLICGTSHRVRPEREATTAYMGAPLVTFAAPAANMPFIAPPSYRRRAYVVAGVAVLANVATRGDEAVNIAGGAPVGLVVAGSLSLLLPLIGMATSFGRGRRALVLLLIALLVLGATIVAAGRIYVSDPRNPSELAWPLPYTFPLAHDS